MTTRSGAVPTRRFEPVIEHESAFAMGGIAITGADLDPRLDGACVPRWQAVPAARNLTLSFGAARHGARACLAVAGSIDVPVVLGSRSTYTRARLGSFGGRTIRAGDRLPLPTDSFRVDARRLPGPVAPALGACAHLRVLRGSQDQAFTTGALKAFFSTAYRVSSQSDRMGYRFEGPRLRHTGGADIISDGTPPGAVQVTGDGQLVLLLADRGTTGGCTKIATLITADLPRAGQLAPRS